MGLKETLSALVDERVEAKRAVRPVDVVSPEARLRSVCFQTLAEQMLALDIDEMDATLRNWIDDVQRARELLAPLVTNLALESLGEEVQSLLVLLKASVGASRALM